MSGLIVSSPPMVVFIAKCCVCNAASVFQNMFRYFVILRSLSMVIQLFLPDLFSHNSTVRFNNTKSHP